jgi:hypothetical protein
LAREAEIIPFPKEEATPPVTKMYLAGDDMVYLKKFAKIKKSYREIGCEMHGFSIF